MKILSFPFARHGKLRHEGVTLGWNFLIPHTIKVIAFPSMSNRPLHVLVLEYTRVVMKNSIMRDSLSFCIQN